MEGKMQILVRHEPAPGTLGAGQSTVARCTDDGILLVSGGGGGVAVEVIQEPPLSYDSIVLGGLAGSGVIRAASGTLLDANGYNASVAVRYFQLFDAAAVPAPGTVPATIPIEVPPGVHFSIAFADSMGRRFASGISWASSTTQLIYTPTPVGDMIINAQYRP